MFTEGVRYEEGAANSLQIFSPFIHYVCCKCILLLILCSVFNSDLRFDHVPLSLPSVLINKPIESVRYQGRNEKRIESFNKGARASMREDIQIKMC